MKIYTNQKEARIELTIHMAVQKNKFTPVAYIYLVKYLRIHLYP